MTRMKRDLTVLAELTGLVHDADKARMNAMRRREAALRKSLAALDSDWIARTQQAVVGDIALQSGADHRWQRWIDGRRITLNHELARVLVEMARTRTSLSRSFGRDLATRDLVRQVTRKDVQACMRRVGPDS